MAGDGRETLTIPEQPKLVIDLRDTESGEHPQPRIGLDHISPRMRPTIGKPLSGSTTLAPVHLAPPSAPGEPVERQQPHSRLSLTAAIMDF